MIRITQNMMKNDIVYNLNKHEQNMDSLQNSLSTGKKVRLPHENPVAATNAMLYRSRITEIRKFIDNIEEGQARLNITEGAVRNVTDILHRVRELTIQGANGTYERNDRAKIAVEVNELLNELVEISNTKFKNESIFAGFKVDRNAFEALKSKPDFADREVITKVVYRGDIGIQQREIEQQEYAGINLAGNNIFWAGNDGVIGGTNVAGFTAANNQKIRIDGKAIPEKRFAELIEKIRPLIYKMREKGLSPSYFETATALAAAIFIFWASLPLLLNVPSGTINIGCPPICPICVIQITP